MQISGWSEQEWSKKHDLIAKSIDKRNNSLRSMLLSSDFILNQEIIIKDL